MEYREIVEEARRFVLEIAPSHIDDPMDMFDLLVDIREHPERAQGAIPGSAFLPRGILERDIALIAPERGTRVLLYCEAGQRSVLAAKSLQEMGYTAVSSLAGGFEAWKAASHRWEVPSDLTTEQRVRYDRHLRLPGVGEAGQRRLLESRVLIVGAGGLGSPAALYLAAAGVGTLGIVDGDRVDVTNLQRQILHTTRRVGDLKVESARTVLNDLNPDVKVETHPIDLVADNAVEVLSGYDLIVDAADNFPTRYLLNDAALRLRIPVVHGSVYRFEGQASFFEPYAGPCYRCLFPKPAAPEVAPACAEAGVLGALPGIIGSIQAIEALKYLLGTGNTLRGRLLIYDSLEQRFSALAVPRDPHCPACGDERSAPPLVDYDEACRPVTA